LDAEGAILWLTPEAQTHLRATETTHWREDPRGKAVPPYMGFAVKIMRDTECRIVLSDGSAFPLGLLVARAPE
jgi:hypothetical protein